MTRFGPEVKQTNKKHQNIKKLQSRMQIVTKKSQNITNIWHNLEGVVVKEKTPQISNSEKQFRLKTKTKEIAHEHIMLGGKFASHKLN